MKLKAAAKNANLVVLIGQAAMGERRMEATGEAYVCGEGFVKKQPPPSAEGTPCGANFTKSGSTMRGTTYSTFTETRGVTVPEAVKRISRRLSAEEKLIVLSSDETAGKIAAQHELDLKARKVPVDIEVVPTQSGVRTQITMKLTSFLMADPERTRDLFCSVASAVASPAKASSKAKTAGNTRGASPGDSVEERLEKLESLYKKKVITKEEYEKKRTAILKDL